MPMEEQHILPSPSNTIGNESAVPERRVVIILNEKIDTGRLMNVCAHLAMGFGASRTAEERAELLLQDFKDASGGSHPNISGLSLIVLKANPTQLRAVRERARECEIPCMDFVSSMTQGSYLDQLEQTRGTRPDDLVYLGVLLSGKQGALKPLTRKFSLFKGPVTTGVSE